MTIEEIKALFNADKNDEAIQAVDKLTQQSGVTRATLAEAYYVRGNAYRRCGNVRMALNSYLEAIELDPDGPAQRAYNMVQQNLAFYDHDLYNP